MFHSRTGFKNTHPLFTVSDLYIIFLLLLLLFKPALIILRSRVEDILKALVQPCAQ